LVSHKWRGIEEQRHPIEVSAWYVGHGGHAVFANRHTQRLKRRLHGSRTSPRPFAGATFEVTPAIISVEKGETVPEREMSGSCQQLSQRCHIAS
jgi:hypothetical protein